MSQADVIDLTGDSDEAADRAEIRGASSAVFCVFLRSHRLLAERERANQSRNLNAWFFRIFQTALKFSCLPALVLVYFQTNASAKSARKRRRKYGDVAND